VSMTVLVTRNVSDRVRGFIASVMLELAPGVYSAPRISPAVRSRVWSVLEDWFANERDASIVLVWQDQDQPGGQSVLTLGAPRIDFMEVDGLVLARRRADSSQSGVP
jgi:CRISPR-associated protein Cas2